MEATHQTKDLRSPNEFKAEGTQGEVEAIFSTFDVVDKDGDIVKSSAITEGQEVPILWSHSVLDAPIGVGVVSKSADQAIIKGQFIDSTAGRDARATVMATKGIQELSWGFRIKNSGQENHEGESVRVITEADVHEVSFVLRGAGEGTGVRDVKASKRFKDQIKETRASVDDLVGRAKSLADLRAQDGRKISDEVSEELSGVATLLQEAAGGLRDLLNAPAPTDDDIVADLRQLRATFVRAGHDDME